MKFSSFTSEQIILVLCPPILLLTTFLLFRFLAATLGNEKAYLYGFLFYWIVWCFLLPIITVGISGLKEMFAVPNPQFGRPVWLGVLLLLGPPLFIFLTRFPESIRGATTIFVASSIVYAIANGTFEEILWRGTYIVGFDGHLFWGYIYPSIWFGLWHLSPQVVETGKVTWETFGFAAMSIILGLVWGWVARTSGSVRWTILAHILLNFASPAGGWFISSVR